MPTIKRAMDREYSALFLRGFWDNLLLFNIDLYNRLFGVVSRKDERLDRIVCPDLKNGGVLVSILDPNAREMDITGYRDIKSEGMISRRVAYYLGNAFEIGIEFGIAAELYDKFGLSGIGSYTGFKVLTNYIGRKEIKSDKCL